MWLFFDTIADCAKFIGAVKETFADPLKSIPGDEDSIKKVSGDINSLLNPPAPNVINVPMGDDQTTPATSGAAWDEVRARRTCCARC